MRLVFVQYVYLLSATFLVLVSSHKNNVCTIFKDYYKIENSTNCYYDPAAEDDVPELITSAGYPLETYKITSPDGYILTLFRLPNVNNPHSNGYSVYMQHGLITHGGSFLAEGKDSLPYVLWDAGYDIWIGNYRGTYYSEQHVNLTVHDKEYWDHSIDEMATIDIPLTMKFIAQTTGIIGNTYYIGHSLGTTMALMYASDYPEEAAEYVKMFVLLAPVYTIPNMMSPYKHLFIRFPKFWKTATKWDFHRLLGQSRPLKDAIKAVCMETPVILQVCTYIQRLLYGIVTGVGPEKLPLIYNVSPGGASLKVIAHASALTVGHFRKFDYGIDNLRKYGSLKPPPYDITKIKAPIYAIYGINDWIAGKKDTINLYNSLPPTARYGIREISDVPFNHIDFLIGPHAKELVYDHIVNIFDTLTNEAPYIDNNKVLL